MIIEKITEKDIPPIVKAFPLSELCSEDDLKAASDLVVSEYDVGYEYHQYSYSDLLIHLKRIRKNAGAIIIIMIAQSAIFLI